MVVFLTCYVVNVSLDNEPVSVLLILVLANIGSRICFRRHDYVVMECNVFELFQKRRLY